MRYTRHFDRLALRPIEASAPQNWGSLSTTSAVQILQSWGESVSISRSYDRGDFRGRYTTLKNRIFVSARSRLYRRIFGFFLHGTLEHAPILPLHLKNAGKSSKNKFKNLTENSKNAVLATFLTSKNTPNFFRQKKSCEITSSST